MEIKARLNYLRIAPRKTRLVAGLIRGVSALRAEQELEHGAKRSALPLLKLLRSASANAEHAYQLSKDQLYVKSITVNPGPVFTRRRPRAFGRAAPIRKRTSHVVLVLETRARVRPPGIKKSGEKPVFRVATGEDMKGEAARLTPQERETEKQFAPARPKKGFLQRVFKRKAI